MHQHHGGHGCRQAHADHLLDEAAAWQFAFANLFDEVPDVVLVHAHDQIS
jgi:hypothetical protein